MKSCCEGLQSQFDDRQAARDLKRFRRRGASRPTKMLLDAVREEGAAGASVLDIGGGVGAIQHLLLESGATRTMDVDVSAPYVEAAREEGRRRGHDDRMEFAIGDFVELSDSISGADIVTLDRVICCYPDMKELVQTSASHAGRLYGLVYPRSGRFVSAVARVANLLLSLRRTGFRVHIHDTPEVDRLIRSLGFERRYSGSTIVWQVFLYARADGA